MEKYKLLIRILANTLLGLILIFIWTRFVDFPQTLNILQTVDIKYIFGALACFPLAAFLRGFRLKILLKQYKLPFKDIVMLNFLSQLLSFFIPVRAGEITKSIYLNSQYNLPLGKGLVWVFIDRFSDFWAVLFLITLFLLFIPTGLSVNLAWMIFIILIVMTIITIFLIKNQQFAKKFIQFMSNFLILNNIKRWFVSFTTTIIEGFEVLKRSPFEILFLMAITIIATIADSLTWIFVFLSIGINLDFGKMILGNSLTALSFIVPAAPGYVGSAEAASLAVFSGILGMPANVVSAATIIFHIFTVVAILIFGVTSLYFLKFDLGLVWKKLRRE